MLVALQYVLGNSSSIEPFNTKARFTCFGYLLPLCGVLKHGGSTAHVLCVGAHYVNQRICTIHYVDTLNQP